VSTSQSAVSAAPVSFDQLPLADAIKTVRGNGQRKVAVFSDPACSYCKRLEPELAGIDNVTVYTFLVPFQGQAKPDRDLVRGRPRAGLAAVHAARRRLAVEHGSDLRPPGRSQPGLAHRLGVQGTPTLFWADGSRTDGYVERAVLEARLNQASQEARP
jgi:thiol:disulfide interchange protein DsbC